MLISVTIFTFWISKSYVHFDARTFCLLNVHSRRLLIQTRYFNFLNVLFMQKDPQKQYLMNDITLLMAVCMKYVFFCLECCIAGVNSFVIMSRVAIFSVTQDSIFFSSVLIMGKVYITNVCKSRKVLIFDCHDFDISVAKRHSVELRSAKIKLIYFLIFRYFRQK